MGRASQIQYYAWIKEVAAILWIVFMLREV